jgi:hypothetical protein
LREEIDQLLACSLQSQIGNRKLKLSPAIPAPSVRFSTRPLFAIGNRKSKIENVVVPVVQRIERTFPKVKTVFLLESSDVLTSAQTAISECLE